MNYHEIVSVNPSNKSVVCIYNSADGRGNKKLAYSLKWTEEPSLEFAGDVLTVFTDDYLACHYAKDFFVSYLRGRIGCIESGHARHDPEYVKPLDYLYDRMVDIYCEFDVIAANYFPREAMAMLNKITVNITTETGFSVYNYTTQGRIASTAIPLYGVEQEKLEEDYNLLYGACDTVDQIYCLEKCLRNYIIGYMHQFNEMSSNRMPWASIAKWYSKQSAAIKRIADYHVSKINGGSYFRRPVIIRR